MRTVLFIFCLFIGIASALSQSVNYYEKTKTFEEVGYTYQCDVPKYQITKLYNKENKFTYQDIVYKSTGKLFDCPLGSDPELIVRGSGMPAKADAIVDRAFTRAQAKLFNDRALLIIMYVSPETGKVIEVVFEFRSRGPYATIPLSVYRSIEVALKKEIIFTPGKAGKQLNVIMLAWDQIPKGFRPSPILPPLTPDSLLNPTSR